MTIQSSIPPVTTDIAEALRLERSRTWDYWLVLCLAVIPIWSTIPICWAFIISSIYFGWTYQLDGPYVIAFRGVQLYALAEVLFSIYHWYLIQRISKPVYTHESSEWPEMQLAFHRVLQSGLVASESVAQTATEAIVPQVDVKWNYHQADAFDELPAQDPRAIDFRNSLRPWFRHMPWSRIRQKDLRRWLCWAIFSSPLPEDEADLPHADRVALNDVCELIRRRTGTVIQDGSDSECQPLLLTLDPVKVLARPLWWYLFVLAANAVTWRMLTSKYNVRYGTYQGLGYLVREPTRKADGMSTQKPRPIVLLHGLGLGLFQYSSLLNHMLDILPERPILVPLHPHISQNFFHPAFLKPMDRHRFADALAGLLQSLGWVEGSDSNDRVLLSPSVEKFSTKRTAGVTMISHSNGSFVHAWMLKAYPELVHRSCFVDPVAFCLWEGDVCNNFLYRNATNGLELVMKYFVATELGVANLMQRNFDWSSNALWYEEIPHARDPTRAMYFIGGQDAIINAERVKRYLQSHGVKDNLRFCPGAHHGEALLPNSKEHAEIMQWLEDEP